MWEVLQSGRSSNLFNSSERPDVSPSCTFMTRRKEKGIEGDQAIVCSRGIFRTLLIRNRTNQSRFDSRRKLLPTTISVLIGWFVDC